MGSGFSLKLTLAAGAIALASCSPPSPTITYANGVFTATGWIGPEPPPGGWPDVFAVRAGDDPKAPPMLGDYSRHGTTLTFTPRFPPSPAVNLHASFRPRVDKAEVKADFAASPEAIAKESHVAHIWPAADEWPANTLRMYVEFTNPMARGDAWTHLRVLDETGAAIQKPFVEVDQELWDPEGKRLTVLFDPGRLKRGLIDNEVSGPPLVAGRKVTIEVDPGWRDAKGAPLAEGYRRIIRVGPEVRTPIDLNTWLAEAPPSTNSDLVIRFPRPLDHALAQRAITVVSGTETVTGKITMEEDDTAWRFTPARPWKPGVYAIAVDGILEDIAGNRMGKLFDVDTSDPTQSTVATKSGSIRFEVPDR
jgi:hypothetical protein